MHFIEKRTRRHRARLLEALFGTDRLFDYELVTRAEYYLPVIRALEEQGY